jgi:hypothetical protein
MNSGKGETCEGCCKQRRTPASTRAGLRKWAGFRKEIQEGKAFQVLRGA